MDHNIGLNTDDARLRRRSTMSHEGLLEVDRGARAATPDPQRGNQRRWPTPPRSPMSESGDPAQSPSDAMVQLTSVTDPEVTSSADFEQSFRQLFLSHPLPMWLFDIQTLAFLEVNDAAVGTYGYSRDEFLAMRIIDIRPSEDVPGVVAMVAEPADELFRPVRRARHTHKDGTVRDVEVTSRRLEYLGRRAALVFVTDITERLRAERERDALLARLGQEAAQRTAIL